MSLVGISGSVFKEIVFHKVEEQSFHGVYVFTKTIVKNWWISVFVYVYLEHLFHKKITSATGNKHINIKDNLYDK